MKRRLSVMFLALSGMGFFLALAAHLASLIWPGILPMSLGILLATLLLAPVMPGIAGKRISRITLSKDFWIFALRGCPRWSRAFIHGLHFYAWATYATLAVFGTSEVPYWSRVGLRGISGLWMAYSAQVFGILYSSWREERVVRHCPAGHRVDSWAGACDQCGLPISDGEKALFG